MPVWARTKLVIWDDLFPPLKKIYTRYSGRHPEKFYGKINELIRKIFSVPDAFIQERNYEWSRQGEKQKFKVEWYIEKPYDRYTLLNIDLALKGTAEGGIGNAEVAMEPRLVTEYPQDFVWQQSLVYEILRQLWHKLFYNRKRQVWMDHSKELCLEFMSELKHFGEELNAGGGESASKGDKSN